MKLLLSFILLLNITMLHADPQPAVWYTHGSDEQVSVHVDLFLSSTCPFCQKADVFFRNVEKKHPWLLVHRYVINQDKTALQTFYERLQQQHSNNFAVPAIFFCNSRWSGFSDADTTGKALLHALSYCRQKITQQGGLTPATMNVLQKWGNASLFQVNASVSRSAPLFAALMGLMEAFSPCSFFCLVAFLAFLWLYPTQKRAQLGLGVIFLLALGLHHYFQQIHTALYYQVISELKYTGMLAGLLLFFAILNVSRKIISRSFLKPGTLIVIAVFFTAFAVQILQQTCTFNVGLILDQWLIEQSFSPANRLYYQAIFQFFYLFPLIILLTLYLIYERYRGKMRYQQIMRIAACLMLMCIAIILIVYPLLLANITASIIVPLVSILIGWLMTRSEVDASL